MIYRDPYSWGGPTYPGYEGELKGDSTAKQAEQQQMQFQSQLMQVFSAQFARQSSVFNLLQKQLQPMLRNPVGTTNPAVQAMRAGATDQISGAYQSAQKALQEKEFSQGGRDLPSGVNAQLDAGLYAQEAADKSAAQNQITSQNYWNALNALNGVAVETNPNQYAGSANSAGDATANLSSAVTASNQSQLLGALGGVAAGAGSALGGYFMKKPA